MFSCWSHTGFISTINAVLSFQLLFLCFHFYSTVLSLGQPLQGGMFAVPAFPITAGNSSLCFTILCNWDKHKKRERERERGQEGHTINRDQLYSWAGDHLISRIQFLNWCKKPQNSIFGCCKDAPYKASACLTMKVPLTERTETKRLVFVLDQCHISRCPICTMPSVFRIIKDTKNNAPNTPF